MEHNKFLSSDGKSQVSYYVFEKKEVKPCAVLQISHGMQEHLTRYAPLAEFLNRHGIVVVGNDHLGHGLTSTDKSTDGFFANKHGANYVLNDLHQLTMLTKIRYPNLPYFLMGHSMGSFFARLYAATFPNELNGLILCGTSGKVKGTNFGLFLLNFLKLIKGKKANSNLADKMLNKSYFKYIKNKTSQFDWITSDSKELSKYLNDERCQIRFTISAYYDMIKTLKKVNNKKWANKLNKDMPIILLSGAQDPVGQYGKGVCWLYSLLEKNGIKHLDLHLYANARHEPFNELEPTKTEFYNDVLSFIKNN